jgi:hypothetical protein
MTARIWSVSVTYADPHISQDVHQPDGETLADPGEAELNVCER